MARVLEQSLLPTCTSGLNSSLEQLVRGTVSSLVDVSPFYSL